MVGNPDIVEAGKATQFSKNDGRARHSANRPWSIRNQVRYLAAQDINEEIEKPFRQLLKGKKITGAQLIAANALDRAVNGCQKATEYATDNIDGKLAQTNINADLEAIKNMTDEELDDFIRQNADPEQQREPSPSDNRKETQAASEVPSPTDGGESLAADASTEGSPSQ